MSDKLNTAYIVRTMQQRLGISRRSVEIKEDDVVEAIEQALDKWNEYRSRIEYSVVHNVLTRENEPFSVSVDSCVIGVRTVYFLVPYYDVSSGLTIFELTEKLTISRLGLRDIALSRSTWENYRRVRGVEPHWHFDQTDTSAKKIVFYSPSGPFDAGYELQVPYTNPVQIEVDRDSHFLTLTEGFTRRILAEIRGKFGGQVLGPGGKMVQLDSDKQMAMADKMIEDSELKLRLSRPNLPVPFMF